MQKFSFKRLTAWMLTVIMLVSAVPVSVSADAMDWFLSDITEYFRSKGDTLSAIGAQIAAGKGAEGFDEGPADKLAAASDAAEVAIFFSDLHTNSSSYKAETVKGIMAGVKTAAGSDAVYSSVTSCGDAFSVNENNTAYDGYTKNINDAIRSVYPNIPVNYVWSDHDRMAYLEDGKTLLDKTSRLVYGAGNDGEYGTDDDAEYYVYALSMGDLCSYDRYSTGFNYTESVNNRAANGFTATVEEAIKGFLADTAVLKKDRPLFIASHQPLYDNRNDNAWAENWFDAINSVAAEMDVAYLCGHNHKYDAADGSEYYYAKGSKMNVATADGWNYKYETGEGYRPSIDLKSEEKTLNFTHMCAGYMAPSSTNSVDSNTTREGVVVAAIITDDSINYVTCDKDGVYDGRFAMNETVARAHKSTGAEQPEMPEQPEQPEDSVVEKNGVSIALPGIIEEDVTVSTVEEDVVAARVADVIAGSFVAYDISVANMPENSTASVTIAIPEGMDADRFCVYYVPEVGAPELMTGEVTAEGRYTFTTTHFSVYVGGVKNDSTVVGEWDDEGEGALKSGYSAVKKPSLLSDDKTYYIASGTSGSVYLMKTNGKSGSVNLDQPGSLADYKFTIKESGNGYTLTDSDGTTLGFGKNNFEVGKDTKFTISIDSNGVATISGLNTNNKTRYIRYNSQNKGDNKFVMADKTSTGAGVYIIEESPGTPVSFKLKGPGKDTELESEATKPLTYEITLGDNTVVNSYEIAWTTNVSSVTVTNGELNTGAVSAENVTVTATLSKVNGTALVTPIELTTDPFKIVAPVVDFTITGDSSLAIGSTSALTPTVIYNGTAAENYVIEWESSDSEVAAVDQEGKVTGKAAGNATITATLTSANGKTLRNKTATFEIHVSERAVEDFYVDPKVITAERNTAASATLIEGYVKYEGDTEYTRVYLPLSLLEGTYNLNKNGTYKDLSLTYAGENINGITLKVVNITGVEDFPAYPAPGSVELKKSADSVSTDFQNTGIARVNLSASGLPYAQGVDVIVMLDLSSSMDRCIAHDKKDCTVRDCTTRLESLQASLELFEQTLKASPNAENIKVAIADFNGFYSSGPVARDTNDQIEGIINASASNKIYTSENNQINAGAFIPATDLNINGTTINYATMASAQGTNYDYAFDTIYQLGSAIRVANERNNQEDRELIVLFMSDGAANQFNFYSSIGGTSAEELDYGWNYWLTGSMTDQQLTDGNGGLLNSDTHAYYYDKVDHDGDGKVNEHRMANAIKGEIGTYHEVIRKSATVAGGVTAGGVTLQKATKPDGSEYADMYMAPGLGATMYAIAFDIAHDGPITEAAILHSLEQVPTSAEQYVKADSDDTLREAFNKVASDIAYAADKARFVDEMGDNFNLQMNPYVKTNNASADGYSNGYYTLDTSITVTTQSVYTRDMVGKQVGGVTVTNALVGKPYGDIEQLEKVKFTVIDGVLTASSNKIGDGILGQDGIIRAQTFFYNTNSSPVVIDTQYGEYTLPGETFYWNIGRINEKQFTLSYTVYLDGSMEGTCAPNESYDTNNAAILYYENYVGNEVSQSVKSPSLPWQGAQISYGFYLVDSQGRPLHADGSVASNVLTAYKVTQPVLYQSKNLNSDVTEVDLDVASTVVPDEYTLFAQNGASVNVKVYSGSGYSYWDIADTTNTTYVNNYLTINDYINTDANRENYPDYDFTHLIVWFAVKYDIQPLPDTVVVDYGLPVDITVLSNDMFGNKGVLAGVGPFNANLHSGTALENGFDVKYTAAASANDALAYGDVTANCSTGIVTYKPVSMQMATYDKFLYAVCYNSTQYFYETVTVIPATTIYYEESFLAFNDSSAKSTVENDDGTTTVVKNADNVDMGVWYEVGSADDATQGEDRPGKYSLVDANNIYGYDKAYTEYTTYSLGAARKVSVDNPTGSATTAPTVTFTFTGKGFDIVSLTDNDSGLIMVTVKDAAGNIALDKDGKAVNGRRVNNYYGYTYTADGKWEVDKTSTDAVYQVPVMKVDMQNYGTYTVTILVGYMGTADMVFDGSYSFWMDAVRIYDPSNGGTADNDTVIEDAYIKDHEYAPHYLMIKDAILGREQAESLYGTDGADNDTIMGTVFIDGKDQTSSVDDYTNPGPNNEAYLAGGQAVAFKLVSTAKPDKVHIGAKLAFCEVGETAHLKVVSSYVATDENGKDVIMVRPAYEETLATATDMYYDITSFVVWNPVMDNNTVTKYVSDTITITSTNPAGDVANVISLTNIKVTYPAPATLQNIEDDEYNAPALQIDAAPASTRRNAAEGTEEIEVAFMVDSEVLESAVYVMDHQNAEPEPEPMPNPEEVPVFEPETFDPVVTRDKKGNNETITIKTSKDVEKITINGIEVKKPKDEPNKDTITWTYKPKHHDISSMYEIIAYNAEGLASMGIAVTGKTKAVVTGTDKEADISAWTGKLNGMNAFSKYDWSAIRDSIMEMLADRKFSPGHFKAFFHKNEAGEKQMVVNTSEDVEYIIADGEIINNYITETIIDLSRGGEETVSRVWLVPEADENAEVAAYNAEGVASEAADNN